MNSGARAHNASTMNEVKTPAELISDPFTAFLKLPSPTAEPPPRIFLFDSNRRHCRTGFPVCWSGAILLDDSGKASLVQGNEGGVQIDSGTKLPFPGGDGDSPHQSQLHPGHRSELRFPLDLVFASAVASHLPAERPRLRRHRQPNSVGAIKAHTPAPGRSMWISTGTWISFSGHINRRPDYGAAQQRRPTRLR